MRQRLVKGHRLWLLLPRDLRGPASIKYLRSLGMRYDRAQKRWFVHWPCRDDRLLRLADPSRLGLAPLTGQGEASTRPTGRKRHVLGA